MEEQDRKLLARRQEIEIKLIERAWKDEAFREALIRDPKGTLAREFSAEFPEQVEIEVVAETDRKKYLVIPQPVSGELSEEELEQVAGGVLEIDAFLKGPSEWGIRMLYGGGSAKKKL